MSNIWHEGGDGERQVFAAWYSDGLDMSRPHPLCSQKNLLYVHLPRLASPLPRLTSACPACSPPTALAMLENFVQLRPGDTVIQNGATSAVGQVGARLKLDNGACLVAGVRVRWLSTLNPCRASMHNCCTQHVIALLIVMVLVILNHSVRST